MTNYYLFAREFAGFYRYFSIDPVSAKVLVGQPYDSILGKLKAH